MSIVPRPWVHLYHGARHPSKEVEEGAISCFTAGFISMQVHPGAIFEPSVMVCRRKHGHVEPRPMPLVQDLDQFCMQAVFRCAAHTRTATKLCLWTYLPESHVSNCNCPRTTLLGDTALELRSTICLRRCECLSKVPGAFLQRSTPASEMLRQCHRCRYRLCTRR